MRLKFQDKQKERFIQQKKNLLIKFKRRIQSAKNFTETEDFMKWFDRIAFNAGVAAFGGFAYIMGRMPDRGFYIFYSILVTLLVSVRFLNYLQKRWHYFLLDFCYLAGLIIIIFVTIGSKNDYLYRISFMYANGALAVATAAFSNKLIFHKFD